MFRWYRDSAKCYVYLADMLTANVDTSRWFERGWTLQELIAPKSGEFFSKDYELLGDKESLERYICEITRIPSNALRGSPLPTFSVAERMSWVMRRVEFKINNERDGGYQWCYWKREGF
jgi:hypothetical protein